MQTIMQLLTSLESRHSVFKMDIDWPTCTCMSQPLDQYNRPIMVISLTHPLTVLCLDLCGEKSIDIHLHPSILLIGF